MAQKKKIKMVGLKLLSFFWHDIRNLHKTIASIEIRLKEKNKDAHWYPAEITDTGAEFIDEAALDVVCDEDELY